MTTASFETNTSIERFATSPLAYPASTSVFSRFLGDLSAVFMERVPRPRRRPSGWNDHFRDFSAWRLIGRPFRRTNWNVAHQTLIRKKHRNKRLLPSPHRVYVLQTEAFGIRFGNRCPKADAARLRRLFPPHNAQEIVHSFAMSWR